MTVGHTFSPEAMMLCLSALPGPAMVLRLFSWLLPVLFALGCGGGGSNGPAYSVDASPASLSFTMEQGGLLPTAKALNVTFKGDGLVVGYPTGTPVPDWLSVSLVSSTAASASLAVQVTNTGMVPGTYTTTLRLVTGKADGSQYVNKDIPVSCQVIEGLHATTNSLAFTAVDGQVPADQTISMASDQTPYAWSLTVEPVNGGPTDWLVLSSSSGTGQTSPVSLPVHALPRPAGNYAATLLLKNALGQVRSRIPVTYQVSAAYGWAGANSARITEAARRPDLDLSLTLQTLLDPAAGSARRWQITSSQPWLTVSPNTGDLSNSTQLVASLDSARLWSLPNGIHLATLTIQFSGNSAAPATFPVTVDLALNPALSVTTPATFTVGAGTTATQLNQTLRVGSNLGEVFAVYGSWQASSPAPWLTLTPRGDVGGNSALVLDLQAPALTNLPAGPQQTQISVLPDDSRIAGTSARLDLAVSLPKVDHVAPYCTWVGRNEQLIIRGSGFAGQASLPVHIGTEIVLGSVLNDTEVRLVSPASTTPGPLPVWIDNALGLARGSSEQVILPPPDYAPVDLTLSKEFKRITLDPERQAVLLDGRTPFEILRIRSEGGAWKTDSFPIEWASGSAVSVDGKSLLVTAGTPSLPAQFLELDPNTLALKRSRTYQAFYENYNQIAGFNDGSTLLISAEQWAGQGLWYPDLSPGPYFGSVRGAVTMLTRDRSRLLVLSEDSATDSYSYDVPGGVATVRVIPHSVPARQLWSLSGNGHRLLMGASVYGRDFSWIGTITTPEDGIWGAAASPDGASAYTLGQTPGTSSWVLRRTDISAPIGPYPASAASVSVNLGQEQVPTFMIVSEDGGTVFVLTANSYFSSRPPAWHFLAVPAPR